MAIGGELAGFRIERVLSRGPTATVYEATQVNLGRRVALKVLRPEHPLASRLGELRWPAHPNVVRLYAAGVSDHGPYLALQLVHGKTLAQLRDGDKLDPAEARAFLAQVADALDAAHAAGITHGAVLAENAFVGPDGHALLSNFGAPPVHDGRAADRAALAALGELPTRERRRHWPALAVAVAATAIAAVAVAALQPWSHAPHRAAPAILAGASVLGSALNPGTVESVDCRGQPPSGASDPCTVAQTTLDSRAVTPRQAGVIRRWTVEGARGPLALEVLRRLRNLYYLVAQTPFVTVPDENTHAIAANLPVRPGDLLGLDVGPGAAVGVRLGAGEARTSRWFGPVVVSAHHLEFGPGSGFDHELMLRAEYFAGARWTPTGILTGVAAARSPAGQVLASYALQQRAERALRLETIRAGNRIDVDLFAGATRIARLPVPDLEPDGQLVSLDNTAFRFGRDIVELLWRNASGLVAHDYLADDHALMPLT